MEVLKAGREEHAAARAWLDHLVALLVDKAKVAALEAAPLAVQVEHRAVVVRRDVRTVDVRDAVIVRVVRRASRAVRRRRLRREPRQERAREEQRARLLKVPPHRAEDSPLEQAHESRGALAQPRHHLAGRAHDDDQFALVAAIARAVHPHDRGADGVGALLLARKLVDHHAAAWEQGLRRTGSQPVLVRERPRRRVPHRAPLAEQGAAGGRHEIPRALPLFGRAPREASLRQLCLLRLRRHEPPHRLAIAVVGRVLLARAHVTRILPLRLPGERTAHHQLRCRHPTPHKRCSPRLQSLALRDAIAARLAKLLRGRKLKLLARHVPMARQRGTQGRRRRVEPPARAVRRLLQREQPAGVDDQC
eukprot:4014659-Prymnesium_polylepis.1